MRTPNELKPFVFNISYPIGDKPSRPLKAEAAILEVPATTILLKKEGVKCLAKAFTELYSVLDGGKDEGLQEAAHEVREAVLQGGVVLIPDIELPPAKGDIQER